MRSTLCKWLLIVAVLLFSSGSGAHALAVDAAPSKAAPCATHQHHHDADHHLSAGCCCTLGDLVTPPEPDAPPSDAYDLHLSPAPAAPLTSRLPSPELDPPRRSASS